jgi:alpha-glucoside transport system substrate-binding protein
MLRQEGPEAYDQWVTGELEWTSDEVRGAFETFGEALDASHGGPDYIVNTAFGRAANPMFEDPPGCLLHHQASFITDFFVNEAGAAPEDFDFFPFPDINEEYAASVTGGGDLVGMFNDTPQARSLIEYLLTAEAQQIWVERGGFISANRDVPLDAYPDDVARRSAEILQNAETFRFDASDAMPAAVADAFNAAMVSFAQNQGDLDAILERVDRVRQDAANQ